MSTPMKDKETMEYRIARLLDEYFTMKKDGGYLVIENLMEELGQEAERRGRIKQLKEDIEQVEIFLPKEVSDTDKYWIPTQIIMELEDDIKLLEEEK